MQIEMIGETTALIDTMLYKWDAALGLWVSRGSSVCYHENFTVATGFRTTELRWRCHGRSYSSGPYVEMALHEQGVNPVQVYVAHERGEYRKWVVSGWRGFLPLSSENCQETREIWGSETNGDIILGLDSAAALRLRKLSDGRYVALGLLRGTWAI